MLTGNMQYDGTSIKSSNDGGGDSSVIHNSSTDSVRRRRTSLPSQAISPGEHRQHLRRINWWWGHSLTEKGGFSQFPVPTPHPHEMTMARLLRRVTTAALLLRVLSTTTNYAFAFTTKSYSPPSTPRDYQRPQQQLQQHVIQEQQIHCRQQQFTLRALFETSNNHERDDNNDDDDDGGVSNSSSSNANDVSTPTTSPPPFTNPTSPEEVIQNQLYYYQHNLLDVVYDTYCSPGNKAATGSYDEFVKLVQCPPYDLIVGHERADVLLELVDVKPPGLTNYGMYGMIEVDDDDDEEEDEDDEDKEEEGMIDNNNGKVLNVACCLVCIRPNKKARSTYPVWFWWEMSLVEDAVVDSSTPITTISADDEWIGKSFGQQTTTATVEVGGNNNKSNSVGNDNNIVYDYDDFASSTITAISKDESVDATTTQQRQLQSSTSARWLVDCISPDFDDLDFETESLSSIEDFMDDDDGDDDDEGGDYDDITIFLDY